MMATTAVVAESVESVEPTMGSAQQVAEDEWLSFAATPGPGYSEGGDVYDPKPPPSARVPVVCSTSWRSLVTWERV